MNNNRIYNAIIGCSLLLFFPLGLFLIFWHQKFKAQKITSQKWESILQYGMFFICIEMIIASFVFYQFGRYFIHIIGTFY